jgi:hypothetical protein
MSGMLNQQMPKTQQQNANFHLNQGPSFGIVSQTPLFSNDFRGSVTSSLLGSSLMQQQRDSWSSLSVSPEDVRSFDLIVIILCVACLRQLLDCLLRIFLFESMI